MARRFRNRFRGGTRDGEAPGVDDPEAAGADDPADDSGAAGVDGPADDPEAAEVDGPEAAGADGPEGEWLVYELHEWASQSRVMLAQLLIADSVAHSWQGTTLLVHESLEDKVDLLVDEVKAAENPELDPDEPQVAFEMEGWSGEMQARLTELLGADGIRHEFDSDGDLVCHEADEDHIESLIDDLLARAADEGMEELVGLEANELLSALFDATDRLRRDVRDTSGVLGAVRHGRRLAGAATPFGFSATGWASLRDNATELADTLDSEEATDADIVDLAAGLRDALQRVI